MTREQDHTTALAVEFESVFTDLRGAMRQALLLHVRPSLGARAASRALGLDKSIGWKMFQLAFSEETRTPSSLVPGARGWTKVVQALRDRGTPMPVLEILERAIRRFEEFLSSHRLVRSNLDSLASSGDAAAADERHLVRLRKEAADATATVLGMRMRARVGTYVIAPAADGEHASLAALTLIHGPERHVGGAPWPLYSRNFVWRGRDPQQVLVETDADDPLAPLERDLSSPNLGDAELRASPPGAVPGVDFIGRRADRAEPLVLAFAEHAHAVGPLYRAHDEDSANLGLPVANVLDLAVFDVLLHRGIPRSGEPRWRLDRIGRPPLSIEENGALRCEAVLERPASLKLPAELGALDEAYRALVRRGAAMLGTRTEDLEHYRVVVPYPPLSTRLGFIWSLAERPAS